MSRMLVARNSALLVAAQVVARLGGLVVFVALTRGLSVSQVGLFSYALSLVSFLTLAVDFGLDMVVTRETARGQGSHGAGLALKLKTIIFGVGYPILLVSAFVLTGPGRLLAAIGLLGAAVWHESANRTIGAWFLARGQAEYSLASDAVSALFRVVLVLAVLAGGAQLLGVAAAYVAATAVTAASLATWAWRRGFRPQLAAARGESWRIVREAAAFAVYGLLFQIYFRIDVILLTAMRPASDVGQYAAAFRVIEVLLVIPAAMTGALFPVLSKLDGEGNRAAFARACGEATRGLAGVTSGVALLVGVAAPAVILVIAGRRYADAAGYLRFLLPTYVFVCLSAVGLLALNAVGRQRTNAWLMLAAATAKVAWNLAFLREGGVPAVCWGSALTSLLTACGAVVVVRGWYPAPAHVKAWSGAAASALAGAGAAWLLRSQPLPVQVVAAGAVFACLAAATRAVARQDLDVAMSLVRRRPRAAEAVKS